MACGAVLCVLIGLPGAGKTTLAKMLQSEMTKSQTFEVIHVCFDELFTLEEQKNLVVQAEANPDNKLFREARDSFYEVVSQFLTSKKYSDKCPPLQLLGNIDMKKNHVLILDDNFYYKSMRYKYYQLACQFSCGYCQLYVECDEHVASQRNSLRTMKVVDTVISVMNGKLETPCKDISWEQNSLVMKSENIVNSLPFISDLFLRCFDNHCFPLEDRSEEIKRAQLQCLQNLLHRSDLVLRNLITNEIRNYRTKVSSPNLIRQRSLSLNQTRQEILSKLRNKTLVPHSATYREENISDRELTEFLKTEFDHKIT